MSYELVRKMRKKDVNSDTLALAFEKFWIDRISRSTSSPKYAVDRASGNVLLTLPEADFLVSFPKVNEIYSFDLVINRDLGPGQEVSLAKKVRDAVEKTSSHRLGLDKPIFNLDYGLGNIQSVNVDYISSKGTQGSRMIQGPRISLPILNMPFGPSKNFSSHRLFGLHTDLVVVPCRDYVVSLE